MMSRVSGVSVRMSRGCYEETAGVELQLYGNRNQQRMSVLFIDNCFAGTSVGLGDEVIDDDRLCIACLSVCLSVSTVAEVTLIPPP